MGRSRIMNLDRLKTNIFLPFDLVEKDKNIGVKLILCIDRVMCAGLGNVIIKEILARWSYLIVTPK